MTCGTFFSGASFIGCGGGSIATSARMSAACTAVSASSFKTRSSKVMSVSVVGCGFAAPVCHGGGLFTQ